VECFRRLLLASVIGIASEDSALAPVLGFLLCLVFLHLFCKRPFKGDVDCTLGIVLTYSLAFIFLGALLIKVDAQPNGELERRIFEVVLIFLLLMGPGLVIYTFLQSFCMKRLQCCKKQAMIPGQPRGHTRYIEMLQPRIQASLVRSQNNTRVNTRLPRTGIEINTKAFDFGPRTSNSGVQQLSVSNPMSTIEAGIELNEITEESSPEIMDEGGIELENIEENSEIEHHLSVSSLMTTTENGIELKEFKEESSKETMDECGIELDESQGKYAVI